MVTLAPISTLVLGFAWQSDRMEFVLKPDDTPIDLTGRTLNSEWREHATETVLLELGTADGGIVVESPTTNGYAYFVLTETQSSDLKTPATEAYPGQNRMFDVRIFDPDDSSFICDLSIKARV